MIKSLPFQVHLQISEALEKVVGSRYRPELLEYEKKKVADLHEYSLLADPTCIKILHNRL